MSFVYPGFLWALFAIAIPIAIHLLNLKRPKKVFFSNIRFLKSVEEKSSRKIKLRHWLILLTRIAAIICLVLAFAKPFLPTGTETQSQEDVYSFYLDNSQSMGVKYDAGKTVLEQSMIELEKLISKLPKNARVNIMTNDFTGNSLVYNNPSNTISRLRDVSLSRHRRLPTAVLGRQREALRYSGLNEGKMYWISDFQMNQFNGLDSTSKPRPQLIRVGSEDVSNLFIDSIAVSEPFIRAGENVTLRIFVRNTGGVDKAGAMNVTSGGIQLGYKTFEVKSGRSQLLELSLVFNDDGVKRCKISLTDNDVTFDNEFHFVLEVGKAVQVYELFEPGSSTFESVFKNESAFRYSGDVIGEVNLSDINRANLLIINELKSLSAGTLQHIREYVQNGGNVLITPFREYSHVLKEFGADYSLLRDSVKVKLAFPESDNPFFKDVFTTTDKNATMPVVRPLGIFKYFDRSILKSITGKPVLISNTSGNGMVYASAFPWNADASNIRRHGLIVPILYRIAMLSSPDQKLFNTFGQPIYIRNIENVNLESIKMTGKSGSVVPQLQMFANKLSISLPDNLVDPGHYDVIVEDSTIAVVALNQNTRESYLNYLSKTQLEEKGFAVFANEAAINFSSEFSEKIFGLHLWKYCLIAGLLFLAFEIVLIRLL